MTNVEVDTAVDAPDPERFEAVTLKKTSLFGVNPTNAYDVASAPRVMTGL